MFTKPARSSMPTFKSSDGLGFGVGVGVADGSVSTTTGADGLRGRLPDCAETATAANKKVPTRTRQKIRGNVRRCDIVFSWDKCQRIVHQHPITKYSI